ncbi:hypothetical protein NDU88_006781 [Pleurodeles waltl]|uniref:Uncharacterized protein n=1 Tax=Pleurodeles waltl TaxID=8319 RepID=A0AAV7WFG6_PLEWA|nr:hypothetical protein NDU88_006781 [Pleurodeles waltl]
MRNSIVPHRPATIILASGDRSGVPVDPVLIAAPLPASNRHAARDLPSSGEETRGRGCGVPVLTQRGQEKCGDTSGWGRGAPIPLPSADRLSGTLQEVRQRAWARDSWYPSNGGVERSQRGRRPRAPHTGIGIGGDQRKETRAPLVMGCWQASRQCWARWPDGAPETQRVAALLRNPGGPALQRTAVGITRLPPGHWGTTSGPAGQLDYEGR